MQKQAQTAAFLQLRIPLTCKNTRQARPADLKDQLEQLQKQLADCTLSAPIGGVVTAVNVSVGDKNTAGTTMITIEDTSSLKVDRKC